jgi:hypothetical protein
MFNNFTDFIYTLITIFVIFVLILVLVSLIYSLRNTRRNPLNELSFEELFQIVNIIISNEVSLYERNVFNNGGKILSRESYDNYYKDILENVFNSFSDNLVSSITVYIDKDSFYSMVSREIMVYLNNKIM